MPEQEDLKIEAVASQLRELIIQESFGTEGRLPTVTQLAKKYGVSRTTMYQILSLLRLEGLLDVRDTSYWVHYPLERVPAIEVNGSPTFDKLLEKYGLTAQMEFVEEPVIIPAAPEIAKGLDVPVETQVIYRYRKQGTAEVPYRLQEQWFPIDLAGQFFDEIKRDPKLNVAGAIRKATNGEVAVTSYHDTIIVRLPTSQEVILLNIARAIPVLEIRKQFFSQQRMIMAFVRAVCVSTYFELEYDYLHERKS